MIVQSALLIGVTALAATVGTVSGFGISSLMIPVLLFFYPLSTVLLFVAVIHLCGDVWKILFFRKGANWRLIAAFGVPGILLSYTGASVTLSVDSDILKRLLGLFLLFYVVFLFIKQRWRMPRTTPAAVAGGSLSGFFAGIFGVGGAVRGAFLSAYDLPKETYIYMSGMIALFIDLSRIGRYVSGGMTLNRHLTLMLIVLIPLSLLGAWIARKIVNRIPQKAFRPVIAALLGLAGLKYLIFA